MPNQCFGVTEDHCLRKNSILVIGQVQNQRYIVECWLFRFQLDQCMHLMHRKPGRAGKGNGKEETQGKGPSKGSFSAQEGTDDIASLVERCIPPAGLDQLAILNPTYTNMRDALVCLNMGTWRYRLLLPTQWESLLWGQNGGARNVFIRFRPGLNGLRARRIIGPKLRAHEGPKIWVPLSSAEMAKKNKRSRSRSPRREIGPE